MRDILFACILGTFALFTICFFVLLIVGPDIVRPLGIGADLWLGTLYFAAFGVFSFLLGAAYRRITRRLQRALYRRPQLDDTAFAEAYFSGAQPEIAVTLRELLARNRQMDLRGLQPDDRLDEDLDADLINNPALFCDIQERFGLSASADEDLDKFQTLCESLETFKDLVDYVEATLEEENDSHPGTP